MPPQQTRRVMDGYFRAMNTDHMLHALDLSVDVIGTSDGWGVEKPSPAFSSESFATAVAMRLRSCTSAIGPTAMHARPRRLV